MLFLQYALVWRITIQRICENSDVYTGRTTYMICHVIPGNTGFKRLIDR